MGMMFSVIRQDEQPGDGWMGSHGVSFCRIWIVKRVLEGPIVGACGTGKLQSPIP